MKCIKYSKTKRLTLVIALLLSVTLVNAQMEKPYIEVSGATEFTASIVEYNVELVLTPAVNYDYQGGVSFSEIKKNFDDAVIQSGFKKDQFVEDKFAFVNIEYPGEGTLYKFVTSSADEFMKLKQFEKVRGVKTQNKRFRYKIKEGLDELQKLALENARKKAMESAAQIGKKLGDILVLSDLNSMPTLEQYVGNYYTSGYKNYYMITVRYAIE